ncbi:MAG TPA: alpha/beta hydrolase [Stellaceae bacterium]|nr:alpha/beta hydrolase [Stellaceae bacterium]
MPLDPQIKALLDKAAGLPEVHTLPVAEARVMAERRVALMAPPAAVGGVALRNIAGPGGALALRLYTPAAPGPHPLLVFFHGSGFVLCSLDTHDGMCRNLCAGARCAVVSVDYRLAPEHKFPAALDDCVASIHWAAAHAAEFGADPARLVVAGDSAGGNLAAAAALRLRDEGKGPPLAGQLLIYPVTDYHTPAPPSYAENAEGYGLTRKAMEWFWGHYLNDPREAANPYAAPLRAKDLSSLPPAFVMTAEYDPLRDEGERYAERLRAAGVPTVLSRRNGMNHGFLFWAGIVDEAGAAMTETCAWLRRTFG